MLEQICAHIHNYFLTDENGQAYGRHEGPFEIVNGGIVLDGYETGDYFLVRGDRRNDGVYQYPAGDMTGTVLEGEIWDMRPPKALLELATEISGWVEKYGDVMNSPYSSESFGGYSYSKAQSYASAGGGTLSSWQSVFASRLNQWRKLC